jgi:hypothetical protein
VSKSLFNCVAARAAAAADSSSDSDTFERSTADAEVDTAAFGCGVKPTEQQLSVRAAERVHAQSARRGSSPYCLQSLDTVTPQIHGKHVQLQVMNRACILPQQFCSSYAS